MMVSERRRWRKKWRRQQRRRRFSLAGIRHRGHERVMDAGHAGDAGDAGDVGSSVDGTQSTDGTDALWYVEGRRRELRRCWITSGREIPGCSIRHTSHSRIEIYAASNSQSLGWHQIGNSSNFYSINAIRSVLICTALIKVHFVTQKLFWIHHAKLVCTGSMEFQVMWEIC